MVASLATLKPSFRESTAQSQRLMRALLTGLREIPLKELERLAPTPLTGSAGKLENGPLAANRSSTSETLAPAGGNMQPVFGL